MNIQKMMKQAQEMQTKIATLQTKLEAEEVGGAAGGGMVKVLVNGKHSLLKVNIDDSLMKLEEKEMLEDLIVAAFNDAKEKIDTATSTQMSAITSGLNLPAGMKLPF